MEEEIEGQGAEIEERGYEAPELFEPLLAIMRREQGERERGEYRSLSVESIRT